MPRAPREFELTVRVAGSSDVSASVKDHGLASSNPNHILLLVHGYNNSHDDAETSYKLFIKHLLEEFGNRRSVPDAIAKFHWPGDESTLFGTTVGYPFDINHARDAARRLATYLARLPVAGSGASRRITIVGHSMGCRLILEALGRLSAASTPGIEIVGLMAAASPVEFVKRSGRLFKTGNPPRRMLKFFSEQDLVLQAGFPLGQWLAFQWQIEDDNYAEAVGRHGHPGEFGSENRTRNGHSAYWGDQSIVAILVRQIDATTPAQIPGAEMPARPLPPTSEFNARGLPTRMAPFDSV